MGNCAKSIQDKNGCCSKLPLQNKANKMNKSGQLSKFKQILENKDKIKPLKWNQPCQSKCQLEASSSNIESSLNKKKIMQNNERSPNKGNKSKYIQQQNLITSSQKNTLTSKLAPKQLSFELNKQNIQRCYENGLSLKILPLDQQYKQLPRPEAQIIKILKPKVKNPDAVPILKQQKQSVDATNIQRYFMVQTNNLKDNQESSIINCFQSEEMFEGMYVQGSKSSIIHLRVSTSNIEFILPKSGAGPLIVSQIDYNYYTV